MRCPSCNHDSPADASFCEECGAKLELICPACKASVSLGARFCKKCGTAIGPRKAATSTTLSSTKSQIIVAADSAASEAIEGERKTVTALFADIRGSTELMEDLDPEEARAIIDPALKLMIDAAHRYDGYVVQSTGDGIFALFGAPVADEDHPQRALYAALRMQEELKRYSAKVVADGGVPIEARIGVNTGEVVVRSIMTGDGHTEYTPIGHTANLASRMQAIAPTGSIAIIEHTRRLVEGYFQLKGRGPTRVKGLSEAVNVYEVTGLGPLRTRLQVLGIDSTGTRTTCPLRKTISSVGGTIGLLATRGTSVKTAASLTGTPVDAAFTSSPARRKTCRHQVSVLTGIPRYCADSRSVNPLRCQRANIRRIWCARTDVVDPDLPMDSYLRTHFALSTVRRRRWFWSHGYAV